MLIRREDFGDIEKLSRGSDKKIWFTCDVCGIGVLQTYSIYLRQKEGKFCKSCRQKHVMNKPERKLKAKLHMEKQWKDDSYRTNISKALSKGCKEAWKKDDGTRRKIVSKNTSKVLKEKWQDKEFYDYQVQIQRETHNTKEFIEKAKERGKKIWDNEELRKRQSERLKGHHPINKYDTKIIKEKLKNTSFTLLSEYKSAREYITLMCDKGHVFSTLWNTIQQGHDCPYCASSKGFSKAEKEISEYIKSLNIHIIENDRKTIKPLELDILIPSHKIAIEYCGLYHHSEKRLIDINYHLNKLELTNKAGYKLITIFEDEWLNKNDIVKNRLLHILNLSNEKIHARKCIIKEIDTKQTKDFINKHHIQGYQGSNIKLGAFHENKLVSIMTFSKPSLAKGRKNNNDNVYEISRFCTNCNIIGIASKFLKYFQKNYEWNEIFSYADRRWSEGNLYEKIGMKLIKNTKPNYWYFKCKKRHHRFEFRKNVLKDKLENFDPDLTEYENMLNNGWCRIWDCGHKLFSIKK